MRDAARVARRSRACRVTGRGLLEMTPRALASLVTGTGGRGWGERIGLQLLVVLHLTSQRLTEL